VDNAGGVGGEPVGAFRESSWVSRRIAAAGWAGNHVAADSEIDRAGSADHARKPAFTANIFHFDIGDEFAQIVQ
jgi:hypothetical protein